MNLYTDSSLTSIKLEWSHRLLSTQEGT